MSIKNLFNSNKLPKVSKTKTTEDVKKVVESTDYVRAKNSEFNKFVPPIDFSTASNFAKFGSVELYYQKAFERIHNYYPYDGTLHEKTEFKNSSSYFDMYVLDNVYPRTNGYLELDGDYYITVFGGPHTASGGMKDSLLNDTFDYSMKYDEEKRRTSAFEYRGEDGISLEFWMKVPNTSATRTIMHVTGATGEIKLELNSSDAMVLTVGSGSTTFSANALTSSTNSSTDWHHYAFTMISGSSGAIIKSYKNGQFKQQTTHSSNIPHILPTSDGQNMWLAASKDGSQVLVGAIDEFRFWKKERSHEEIFNTWFMPVGGGTNKYDSNVDLSLYFKFNEGKTGNSDIDSVVLDYSGRINNGYMTGSGFTYSSSYRNTGSAIREKLGQAEFLDPIIYSSHPTVVSLKEEYMASGSITDLSNTSMMYRYLPGWMQEEDEQNGKNLKYLTQIMASHLDTLWHQIDYINKIKDNRYIQGDEKPLPFAKNLLLEEGFYIPDLFSKATVLERFKDQDENQIYAESVEDVKNTIYQNLYNSIKYIQKSKGTEKSFRNFFNAIGIEQDVVKINKYADDSTFVLRDNYEHKSVKKRFLNFSLEDNWEGTIYHTASIPGDTWYTGSFTLETEIFLPDKRSENSILFSPYSQLTSSVMGYFGASSTPDVSVFVVRDRIESTLIPNQKQRVKFVLSGAFGEVETSFINEQYSGNKWNLALRLKHEGYPFNNVVGSDEDNYQFELYGVESEANNKLHSFTLTASATRSDYSSDKTFYAGASRTNLNGAVIEYTDINLGHLRYWQSYMKDSAVDQNSFDPTSMGTNEPFENDIVNAYSIEIPREKTIAFNWAFSTITGSDSSGEFIIPDLSSGSMNDDYGNLSDTIQRYVPAQAYGFQPSSTRVVNSEYIFAAAKRRPDDLMSSDLITIKDDESKNFFVDEDVSDNFYSFEKSMYAAISDEMMNLFTTALDYNNLIGQPNQKYHTRYNMLDFLRDRFFDDVQNEPDLEKFTSFYKWIDDSISIALEQLTPAGSRFSEKVNNIVESHILERNKYQHKFPLVTDYESTEGSIRGISEMKYDWKYGHAPVGAEDEEQKNCLWQRERKIKDSTREPFRTVKNNHSIQSAGIVRHDIQGNTYLSDVYAIRKFAKLYDVEMVSQNTIHGGPNFSRRKNMMLFHQAIAPNGPIGDISGAPQNVITVGVGDGDGLVRKARCTDDVDSKKKFGSVATVGQLYGEEYGTFIKGDEIFPMNIMSGNVHSGFNKQIKSYFASDVVFSNLHNDIVGKTNDISMQGPFTNAHVGGLKYRHIDINRYDENKNLTYVSSIAGNYPTGTIEFDVNVLQTKYLLGTSSWVQVKDSDGTVVRAVYSDVYDLYDNQFTNMDQLQYIFNNKLDITSYKVSDSILNITQSSTGSFYNHPITTAAHGFITASGFSGGTNLVFTTSQRHIDGPDNRPEGWGIVFKDHPSQGDNDGAFGFIGADYGSPYPFTRFLKAEGYRSEFAKRPLNIRNIKTSTESSQVGNYKHGQEIFQVQPYHQKTWAKRAYEDSTIDLLPPFISETLPDTTHYQTLISRKATEAGNVFVPSDSSLFVEEESVTRHAVEFTSNVYYEYLRDTSVTGYSTTSQKTFSFWFKLRDEGTDLRYLLQTKDASNNQSVLIYLSSGLLYFIVYGTAGVSKQWRFSIDYATLADRYSNLAIVWAGQTVNDPQAYLNGVALTKVYENSVLDFTEIRPIEKIFLGDVDSSSTSYEARYSIILAGIWNAAVGIDALYNNGIPPVVPLYTTNLVDHWAFGESIKHLYTADQVIADNTIFSSSYGSGGNDLTAYTTFSSNLTMYFREFTMYPDGYANKNVITRPRTDLTGSEHNITTRFSAPGGPEVQSVGYLDAWSQTYSVHNAMPYRNLSVLGSGSGEQGTIRVTDHLGERRGLKTLLGLHMGKFGVDSTYGVINSSNYEASASFLKQHRNRSRRMEYSGTSIITGSNYDNGFINTPIPRSELQYSWIKAATSGSDAPMQNILGYSPRDGIISSSAGWVDALVFPTASSIFED